MAKFHLELDTRVKLKNDRYNLGVRVGLGNDNIYLKYVPLTVAQYESVFIKKASDPKSVEFRTQCFKFLSKCETIFAEMETFNKARYRDLVYGKVQKEELKTESILLTDLCTRFLAKKSGIRLKTRQMYQTAVNSFDEFKPGLTFWDVTPKLLIEFEKEKNNKNYSDATISAYFRHLRGILNYFIHKEKIIPSTYQYPFGREAIVINKSQPTKFVMPNEEIKAVAEFNDFENPQQEYARNIWLLLYRCNGINYADMFRMKWINKKNNCFVFKRMKTENTAKVFAKKIVVPITPKVQELLDKVAVPITKSNFVLGLLNEDYVTEADFNNKKDWEERKLNSNLKYISQKLNLSIELQLSTARDCFATTLKRAGYAKDVIGEMMGHGNNYISTAHYLAHVDTDKLKEISKSLY